jgi:hypothetical protein
MKPIARIDSTLIAEVKRRVVHVRLYTRDTNFLGVACSPDDAWAEYDSTPSARLRVLDDGDSWSIHISDDRRYELYSAEMPLGDQPGRPPEPGPEIDPDILEEVLIKLIGQDSTQTVFAELDAATALAKLDDPLECTCHERAEPATPDVMTCGVCGRSWCNRCHPAPSARCPSEYEHPEPPPQPRLRWAAGPEGGAIDVTDEGTVTLVLDGELLLGVDLEAGTVLTWPDGTTEHVIATFVRPKPRLQVVATDAEVLKLRPRTT